jgi:hypothetical protein
MKKRTFINGRKVKAEKLKAIVIKNYIAEKIIKSVNQRMSTQETK